MACNDSTTPSIPGRWYVDDSLFKLKWHHWDDSFAVYHPGSAETHILDELPAKCLQLLELSPANIPELSEKLSVSLSLELDDDLHEYVDSILQQFVFLGLVENIKRESI